MYPPEIRPFLVFSDAPPVPQPEAPQTSSDYSTKITLGYEESASPYTQVQSALAAALEEAGLVTEEVEGLQQEPSPPPPLVVIPDTPEREQYKQQLTELYVQHRGLLAGWLRRKTGTSRENAEDAVQEAFLIALRQEQDRPPEKPWYFTVAFRALVGQWHKNKRTHLLGEEEPHEGIGQDTNRNALAMEWIESAIGRLKPSQREVVARLLFGQSVQEISEAIGVKDGSVRKRMYTAHARMREMARDENWHLDF